MEVTVMVPQLIVMLTHNDVTVENSLEIFEEAKSAPCKCWGFKNNGLSEDRMKQLVDTMKSAGKTVFLESLSFSREDTQKSVELAARCGVDYLIGATYYNSSALLAAEENIKFLPFVGNRHNGHLYGEIDEIVAQAIEREKKEVFGINIPVYRYDGDAETLIKRVTESVEMPVSITGSINSFERLDSVKATGCWAFTIGGAFFENKFGENFSKQIEVVQKHIGGN